MVQGENSVAPCSRIVIHEMNNMKKGEIGLKYGGDVKELLLALC